MEIIDQMNRERVLYLFLCDRNEFLFFIFRVFGGILGWDPVHTTCIFCERSYKIFIKLS